MLVAAAMGAYACAHLSSAAAPARTAADTGSHVLALDDLHGVPARQVEELLEGRAAGVRVVRSPRGVSLRLWGPSSILGSNEPLYVLDGMPLVLAQGDGLYWLDPNDIERIEILKDVSATSMYGVRGGNGVVLITTRHGKRRPH